LHDIRYKNLSAIVKIKRYKNNAYLRYPVFVAHPIQACRGQNNGVKLVLLIVELGKSSLQITTNCLELQLGILFFQLRDPSQRAGANDTSFLQVVKAAFDPLPAFGEH